MPIYTPYSLPRVDKVTVDGVAMKECFRVDTDNGFADCYVLSSDGRPIRDGDDLRTQTFRGVVEVTFVAPNG